MQTCNEYFNAHTTRGSLVRRLIPYLCILIIVSFRLACTGNHDIAMLNAPFDEYWYVHAAANLFWGTPYDHMAFVHLPIYPLWLACEQTLGIPARLGIDLAWIAVSGYLGVSISQFTHRAFWGWVSWIFLIFYPTIFILFDNALSETLLLVLITCATGSALEIWNTRDSPSSLRALSATILHAISFALAIHTRKEAWLLGIGTAALFGISIFYKNMWWRHNTGRRYSMIARLCVFPVAVTTILWCFIVGANFARWGLAARHDLAAPGYEKAMAALAQIDAGPSPLHVVVSRKARLLAYQASPTFKELSPFFEGPQGAQLAAYTAQFTGAPNEIGSGWFYWALRTGAAQVGWHRSASYANERYAAIAAELESAFNAGQLRRRPAVGSSFVDPDYGKWIGRIPGSLVSVFYAFVNTNPDAVRPSVDNATPQQTSEYIRVLGRRNSLPQTAIAGWVIAPVDSLVSLVSADGSIAATVQLASTQSRPDVPGAYGFSLSAPTGSLISNVRIENPAGAKGSVDFGMLKAGEMKKTSGVLTTHIGIDRISAQSMQREYFEHESALKIRPQLDMFLNTIQVSYHWLMIILVILLPLGFVSIIRGQPNTVSDATMVTIIICSFVVGARIVVFSLLDASSWNGAQVRYMIPNLPLLVVAGALSLHQITSSLAWKWRRRPL